MTVLCLWLWLRGGRGRLVVAGLWVFFFFPAPPWFVVVAGGPTVDVAVAVVL